MANNGPSKGCHIQAAIVDVVNVHGAMIPQSIFGRLKPVVKRLVDVLAVMAADVDHRNCLVERDRQVSLPLWNGVVYYYFGRRSRWRRCAMKFHTSATKIFC